MNNSNIVLNPNYNNSYEPQFGLNLENIYNEIFHKNDIEKAINQILDKYVEYNINTLFNEHNRVDEIKELLKYQIKYLFNYLKKENQYLQIEVYNIDIEYEIKEDKEISFIIDLIYYSKYEKFYYHYGKQLNANFYEEQLEQRIKRIIDVTITNKMNDFYKNNPDKFLI